MQVHFANVWEAIADEVGDRPALIHGDERVSWREHDEQAARLAQAFVEMGLQPDSKVALYLYNGIEYVTAQYAAFKMRGVPVNVNYRYTDNELLYLLDNSDAEVLCFHTSLGDRVERVLAKATKLRAVIEVDDGGPHVEGALRWEEVLAAHEPAARVEGQPEDIYMLYTGGTTGMPKGVMYTHGVFPLALGGFGAAITGAGAPPTNDDELLALGDQLDEPPVWLAACPQMHGTGMWLGTMAPLLMKGTVVTLTNRSFDAHELWQTVEREGVTAVVIVGDAFAKPMLRALDEKGYEAPSLKAIVSSGVMWSTEVKEGLLEASRRHALRRPRIHRGRDGHDDQHPRGRRHDGEVHDQPRGQGRHRGRSHRGARLRRDRDGRRAQRVARLLQGSGEVGAHVHGDRRRAPFVAR